MIRRSRRHVRLSKLGKRGFTLIEMLIAMVVILLVLLGLVQAALLSIGHNLRNQLRDEAVKIAEQRMDGFLIDSGNASHDGLRNLPFDHADLLNGAHQPFTVIRTISNVKDPGFAGKAYTVVTTVADINDTTGTVVAKNVQVSVGWNYKNPPEETIKAPTNNEYQHTIMTVLRRS